MTQPLEAVDISMLSEMSGGTVTESQDSSGNLISFFNVTGHMFSLLWRSIIADYAFFYNYDSVTQTRTPNDFMIFRYVIFLPISIAFFITLAIVATKYI